MRSSVSLFGRKYAPLTLYPSFQSSKPMEEAAIEVPSHFLCPISLQMMRDPVIVSTGITYDRGSIEKWLFSCKNHFCPVTKQALSDIDLTPNHTLRRLIQAWCSLNAINGVERIPTPKSQLDKAQIMKILTDAIKAPNMKLICLRKLGSIASESERNKAQLVAAGALEFLASAMKNEEDETVAEAAIEILFDLKSSEEHLKILVNKDFEFIDSLVRILKIGNNQSRAHATMLLKSIFEVADPIQSMSVNRKIFAEIVHVIGDEISEQVSKNALKLLAELCPWGRNRIKAVEEGVVMALIELLLNASDKRICELSLVVLDQLCCCAEGRAQLMDHRGGFAVISKKILRVSRVATDRGVRIFSSICKFSATSRVLQEMMEAGVVTKLCLVVQMEVSLKTKERARETLKLHSRVWKNSPCIPPHLLSSYPS